jgi:O-antigen ligase
MVFFGTFRERSFGTKMSRLVAVGASRFGIVFYASTFTMVAALLLGGGTRGGFLSDAILELLAVPALLVVLSSLFDLLRGRTHIPRSTSWALMLCFAIVLLPLLQLVPLPPSLWTMLPGRDVIVGIFALVGEEHTWMPISVSPNATWLSFLSLLPPLAVFLGAIQLNYRERRGLSLVVISVGVLSAFLGLLQIAQGPTSHLRFFAFTNDREAVGFFANRNDFAALIYAVLLFTAAWVIHMSVKAAPWRDVGRAGNVLVLTAAFLVLILLIATEAMARSRAGLILTIVALAGIFAMAATERRSTSGFGASKLLLGATMLAIVLTLQFALYRIMDRFAFDSVHDGRLVFARNTIIAATTFMPFGSGTGTFVPVYAMFEEPADTMAHLYLNHAHDDFLEVWLETGFFGMAVVGVFLIWLGFKCVGVWRRSLARTSELDRLLMRAAALVIWLLIAHSVLEYPLRTGAIMAIFAFSCALLVEPLAGVEDVAAVTAELNPLSARRQAGGLSKPTVSSSSSRASSAVPAQSSQISQPLPRQPAGRWGDDIAWPEEWQKSKEQKPSPATAPTPLSNEQKPPAALSQSGGGDPTTVTAPIPSSKAEKLADAPSQSRVTSRTTATASTALSKEQKAADARPQSGGMGQTTATTPPLPSKESGGRDSTASPLTPRKD